MKDHLIREKVNELTSIAIKFYGTQQLRECIAHAIVDLLKRVPDETTDSSSHAKDEK